MDNSSPIGVFDSGIGGLTVLKEIQSLLPNESTIYLGDTARVPYGIRSPDTVIRYSINNCSFLFEKGIKLLVIACGTASATALKEVSARFPVPVIGAIQTGAKTAVERTRNRRIGVIGTETTIRSGAYIREIHGINEGIHIVQKSCPLFVPLVEEGLFDDPITEMAARRYLSVMQEGGIDTLVLGCTHYPLLKGLLSRILGEGVSLVDSAISTAAEVKRTLETLRLVGDGVASHKYYVTDALQRFLEIGTSFLSRPITDIEKVDIV